KDVELMRILILNTNYPAFMRSLYAADATLDQASWGEQLARFNRAHFGVSDYYPRHLNALGHEAVELHVNCGPMQLAWAREHGVRVPGGRLWPWNFMPRRGFLPFGAPWFEPVLNAQMKHYRPDVVLN